MRAIAERVAAELIEQGAEAVLLAGSQARGDARDDSDIDLFAVGEGPKQRLLRVRERARDRRRGRRRG